MNQKNKHLRRDSNPQSSAICPVSARRPTPYPLVYGGGCCINLYQNIPVRNTKQTHTMNQKNKHLRRDSNPQSSAICPVNARRPTPYPLGHGGGCCKNLCQAYANKEYQTDTSNEPKKTNTSDGVRTLTLRLSAPSVLGGRRLMH